MNVAIHTIHRKVYGQVNRNTANEKIPAAFETSLSNYRHLGALIIIIERRLAVARIASFRQNRLRIITHRTSCGYFELKPVQAYKMLRPLKRRVDPAN